MSSDEAKDDYKKAKIRRLKIMRGAFMKRSLIDRRSGDDKRNVYCLDYFFVGGEERRRLRERRRIGERRKSWVRVSKWCSVYAEAYS